MSRKDLEKDDMRIVVVVLWHYSDMVCGSDTPRVLPESSDDVRCYSGCSDLWLDYCASWCVSGVFDGINGAKPASWNAER